MSDWDQGLNLCKESVDAITDQQELETLIVLVDTMLAESAKSSCSCSLKTFSFGFQMIKQALRARNKPYQMYRTPAKMHIIVALTQLRNDLDILRKTWNYSAEASNNMKIAASAVVDV
jgi:hypothetical protein